jgi:hypothetical protein
MIYCRMVTYYKNYRCDAKLTNDVLQKAEISAQKLHLYYKTDKWFIAETNKNCTKTAPAHKLHLWFNDSLQKLETIMFLQAHS